MTSKLQTVKLKPHIKQVRGIAFKPAEISDRPFDGSVAILKANNITETGLDDSSLIYIDLRKVKKDQFIKAGDILLAASSGSKKVIGKNIFFPTDYQGSFGAFCKLVRPKAGLHPEFLQHFFKTDYYRKSIERSVQGANINNLKNEHLDNLEILLPPLDDQKRIARLLGKVEGLIARRKHHLQQLDDLLKSVFLEMFGDPVRNEKGWDTVPFHKVGKFVSGGTPSKSRDDFWNGDFPWVSPKDMKVTKIDDAIDHISETVFEETSLKRIAPDHLLIVVRGMILAHSFPVAINAVDIAINQDMKAIKPVKGLNVVYLLNCLTSLKRQILKLISTAGHGTRKFDSIAMHKLFIPKPPEDLQNHFAAIVEKVESLKSRYQQSLTDLESLYGALSQKAFKGELDLSRVVLQADESEIAEEEKTDVEEKQPMEPLFELPAPEELALLQTAKGRKALLGEWLTAWLEQLGDAPFAAQKFMDAARQRLWELAEDEAPDWGVAEYDELKTQVFEALEQGRLTQGYDDANNRVQITAVKG